MSSFDSKHIIGALSDISYKSMQSVSYYIDEKLPIEKQWFLAICDNINKNNPRIEGGLVKNEHWVYNIDKINELISSGIDINIRTLDIPSTVPGITHSNNHDTALIIAASNGFDEVVELLLSHPGINPDLVQDYNCNALHLASYKLTGTNRCFELLIDRCDINNRSYAKIPEPGEEKVYRFSILEECLYNSKNLEGVEMLLQRPEINITYVGQYGDDFLKHYEGWYVNNENTKNDDKVKQVLTKYSLQKKILENGREDILIAFNKYGLLNEQIKIDAPALCKALEWGLV